jgi:hypothetical protein
MHQDDQIFLCKATVAIRLSDFGYQNNLLPTIDVQDIFSLWIYQ